MTRKQGNGGIFFLSFWLDRRSIFPVLSFRWKKNLFGRSERKFEKKKQKSESIIHRWNVTTRFHRALIPIVPLTSNSDPRRAKEKNSVKRNPVHQVKPREREKKMEPLFHYEENCECGQTEKSREREGMGKQKKMKEPGDVWVSPIGRGRLSLSAGNYSYTLSPVRPWLNSRCASRRDLSPDSAVCCVLVAFNPPTPHALPIESGSSPLCLSRGLSWYRL